MMILVQKKAPACLLGDKKVTKPKIITTKKAKSWIWLIEFFFFFTDAS